MKKALLLILFAVSAWGQAQNRDSLLLQRPSFEAQKLWAPLSLLATGTAVLATEKRETAVVENKNFLALGGYFEDYAQVAPHAAAYAFEWAGMKPRTDFWNRSAILAKAQIFALGSTILIKKIAQQPRPDGSNEYGFPSGHSANAFAGATLLSMEYGDRYPWVNYAAYTVAGGVAVLRVAHDKHYWSDVLVGAGLGILSTKIAYWTHQYRWNKKPEKDPLEKLYQRKP